MKIVLCSILLAALITVSTEAVDCNPPCQNGVCITGNACVCPQTGEWSGYRCETPLCNSIANRCGPGRCVAPNTCDCNGTNWTGTDCSVPTCNPPCQNGGICNAPGSCLCDGTGYSGQFCDFPLCNEPIGCGPGVCIGRNLCNCTGTGYSGTYCTDAICDPPCVNGKCAGPNGCDCTGTGFIGALCEVPTCNPPCENNGFCTANRTCDCSHLIGWTGERCEKAICTKECLNNGTCSGPDKCDCSKVGYTGTQCELDVDECSAATSPCDVRSICQNEIGGFRCVCPNGYKGGKIVEGGCVDIDECAIGKCDPVVNCTNSPGSYQCGMCPSGYAGTGEKCTPLCDSPCKHGNCTAPNLCTCERGWKGTICDQPCNPNVCVGPTGTVTGDVVDNGVTYLRVEWIYALSLLPLFLHLVF